jgi:hypothetical protein
VGILNVCFMTIWKIETICFILVIRQELCVEFWVMCWEQIIVHPLLDNVGLGSILTGLEGKNSFLWFWVLFASQFGRRAFDFFR